MPSKKRTIKIIPSRLVWIMKHPPTDNGKHQLSKVTRKELADLTGISERTIQTARTTGDITNDSLLAICKELDVLPDYLKGTNDISTEKLLSEKQKTIYGSTNANNINQENFSDMVQIMTELIKVFYETGENLKRKNRMDNNGIVILSFGQINDDKLNNKNISAFLHLFMQSRYYMETNLFDFPKYNDFYYYRYDYEQLAPIINEYIDKKFGLDLSKSINDFIRSKEGTNNDKN